MRAGSKALRPRWDHRWPKWTDVGVELELIEALERVAQPLWSAQAPVADPPTVNIVDVATVPSSAVLVETAPSPTAYRRSIALASVARYRQSVRVGTDCWQLRDGTVVATGSDGRGLLRSMVEAGHRDILLTRGPVSSLQFVTNGHRVMLVLWGREGHDDGVAAVDPTAGNDLSDGYVLDNGQADAYSDQQTVPLAKALEAVGYIVDNNAPDPRLNWRTW